METKEGKVWVGGISRVYESGQSMEGSDEMRSITNIENILAIMDWSSQHS